jgi:hypothetical protein
LVSEVGIESRRPLVDAKEGRMTTPGCGVSRCESAKAEVTTGKSLDLAWLNAPYKNWIDNIQYDGRTISQPSDNKN